MNAPVSVLLTGVTGSLGGQLCAEMLATIPGCVHCPVRASDPDTARRRVATRLAQLHDPLPPASRRVIAFPAELRDPRLGLNTRDYDALAENLDAIVHCAAQVDLAAGYDQLAPINTDATRHLIGLAKRRARLTGRPPAFHYVSTLGTFLNARHAGLAEVDETTEVSEATSGPLGYPRSKAAAEIALWQANAEGLPVTVHRPGAITGHSRTGRTSDADAITPLLWAAVALGAAPICDGPVPAERIDVVARAIVSLLCAPEAAGRAFHLVHPRPLLLSALFDALRRAGHTLAPLAPAAWWQRVAGNADHPAVNPAAAMSEVGRYMMSLDADHTPPQFRCEQTWRLLAAHGFAPEPLDGAFLDRLVAHLTVPAAATRPRPLAITTPRAPATPPRPAPLRIDGNALPLRFGHNGTFTDTPAAAAACEQAGYGTFWAEEHIQDPMLALAAAAPATTTIGLGTNVLVALARSPMTVAHGAHDLQVASAGRFVLGLGPQFAVNLKYRFSMPSDQRLARLREHVAALRAIWAFWNEGHPLAFRGKFYTHAFSSPFFTPPPSPYGPPPIILAATGPRAAELAGEVADGLTAPPYAPPDYLAQVLLPAAERGLARSGRTRKDFTVVAIPLLVTSSEDASNCRSLVAFWCGTRAYRSLFERYERGGLADELAHLSVSDDPDRWRRMTDLIDDELLNVFTINATPGQFGRALRDAFGGHADRVIVPAPAPFGRYTPAALGLAAAATPAWGRRDRRRPRPGARLHRT